MDETMLKAWDETIAGQVALQERILKSELARLQAAAARKIYLEMKNAGFTSEEALDLTGVIMGSGSRSGGGV